MNLSDIQHIAVIGAGVMGRGIALVAARSGYSTLLFDINTEMLDTSRQYAESFFSKSVTRGKMTEEEKAQAISRIQYISDPAKVIADVIIEAVPERLDLKHKVLAPIEAQNGPKTIIASNTSTIPITKIAAGLTRPAQVVGMHFFNPAPIMKLVEVISGEMTDPKVAQLIYDLAVEMGKKAVSAKDEPGFIVNRVARQFYVESLKVLEEQVADHETIDRLMRNHGFRMGPFQLMDLIGIETNHEVTKSMYEAFFFDEKFRPSRIQQKKVDAGQFGRKTGKGFYEYPQS
ncbi:3-hydroxyacyl-CoA dehydrogenase NAD-binding domain-containing protein [Pontibacter sp. G13]|uniref:3-hydroxyacyl-CoA dehydrogenase family protein n=1 Tax=Pontibacter sp. G13 TaxID=3074898 RepID=UPI00288A4437|nr:3-hydroxyacyl-CoA dehydrogenase NAD-binding domain-containing protein [Pontibacter sp. G13]WNJ16165.1 3-hydroxyacyl-CoA dehydrogenase NAD-binding domain-containing protein [Pontibacter sp. G13]